VRNDHISEKWDGKGIDSANLFASARSAHLLLADAFGGLYHFRCHLVHGNKELAKKKVSTAHLGQTREIAPRTLHGIWRILSQQRATCPTTRWDRRRERLRT
jgi:hypothetical protein